MIKALVGLALGLALIVAAFVAALAAMRPNIAHEDPCWQLDTVLVRC
jgi:hypothetical protein